MTSAAGGDRPSGDAASEGLAAVPSLVVLHSPDLALRGRVIAIGEGVSIGRNADSVTIAINDRLLSRRHATVAPVADSRICELVDHESRDGSFVEGLRVTRTHLTRGSIIRLGVTLFELSTDDDDVDETLDDDFDEREPLLGKSGSFREVLIKLSRAAASDQPVTIIGESGTGKKRVA